VAVKEVALLNATPYKLTSSEVSQLWSAYMANTMFRGHLRYYVAKCQDEEIRSFLEYALHIADEIIKCTSDFFKKANHPIPHGFSDEEVDTMAPRLYTDAFFLYNISGLSQYGLIGHGLSLSVSGRSDIRNFFTECVSHTADLYNKSIELMIKKGLYVPVPSVSAPDKVDFIHRKSFLTGWFGDRRPLTVIEINNLVLNLRDSAMAKAVCMAFSQVAKSKEIRAYFLKGVELAQQHVEVFQSILSESGLPAQPTYESEVTNSTIAPFSDKLMMFKIATLAVIACGRFGTALGEGSRRDLAAHYTKAIAGALKYAGEGADIMIYHGWLEQPPTAPNRKALARV
jgi:hypothetical protein